MLLYVPLVFEEYGSRTSIDRHSSRLLQPLEKLAWIRKPIYRCPVDLDGLGGGRAVGVQLLIPESG